MFTKKPNKIKKKTLKERCLHIQSLNTIQFNHLKCIEELNELSLILTQLLTKPRRVSIQDVIDEIGDAKRMIWYLESLYDKDDIKTRIETKIKQIETRKNVSSR